MEARHDVTVGRFVPDNELIVRAHNAMLAEEDILPQGHSRRFVRQRWEEALGATRVTIDALREVTPREQDAMSKRVCRDLLDALDSAEGMYLTLDGLSAEILGETMHGVLTGEITTHEQLDEMDVPR